MKNWLARSYERIGIAILQRFVDGSSAGPAAIGRELQSARERIYELDKRVAGWEQQAEQWEQRAERLWQLLDDIDTLDNAARSDDEAFRRGTRRLQQRRHEYAQSPEGHDLEWLPLEDTHKETAGETMGRLLNSMRPKQNL